MCDPVSAIVGAVAGLGAMAMGGGRPSMPNTPMPEPTKPTQPPQEAKVPTPQELRKPNEGADAKRTGMAATPADTFLTGSQGVRLTEKDTKRKTLLGE